MSARAPRGHGDRPLPAATYRVQLNAAFTFDDARAQVDYLHALGVSHLYCSPVLAARRGSRHGYDVVDPTRVNPELGGDASLRALADALHARDMGLLIDVVPNHMAACAENPYWDDVLARGDRSPYARWFDIRWQSAGATRHQVVLPVLDDERDALLDRGALAVRLGAHAAPRVVYGEQSFPIDPASLPPELQLAQVDPEEAAELTALFSGAGGRDRLRALLDVQHYCLVSWRRAADEINYRRFLDVNDLVALRAEDPSVFEDIHATLLALVADGTVDGLRVDHVDGLRDPGAYLARLRDRVGGGVPIFVEKILALGESLPGDWPVDGTTGYDFLNDVGDVLLDAAGAATLECRYRTHRRAGAATFGAVARDGKRLVLDGPFRADVARLTRLLAAIARMAGRVHSADALRAGVVELTAALPVYRTYLARDREPAGADGAMVDDAMRALDGGAVSGDVRAAAAFIADVLLRRQRDVEPAARASFVEEWQQLCAAAAAKGIEDTAFYRWLPLASRNEVGGAPDRPLDDAVARFHAGNAARAARWPAALIATDTHDAKRSADVRARIAALAELADDWVRAVDRWRRMNAGHRHLVRGRAAPDADAEYLYYQTLIALWPPPRPRPKASVADRAWRDIARGRLDEYMRKAAREAKRRTNWVAPDAEYEAALSAFVAATLGGGDDDPFLLDVDRLVARIAPAAAWSALSQVALHLTAPGTPDLYQGGESWCAALVDPDNRRPVDYARHRATLRTLDDFERDLLDGAAVDPAVAPLKQFVTHRLLALRRTDARLFHEGDYLPLAVRGERASHLVAFARTVGARCAVTLAPRRLGAFASPPPADWWADTAVELPSAFAGARWRSQIARRDVACAGNTLEVASALAPLPVVVVTN